MGERFAIGLDLGGTELKAVRLSRAGQVERFLARPSGVRETRETPLASLAGCAMALLDGQSDDAVGVGCGCPGVIRPEDGSLVDRTAHLPHWKGTPVRDELARRLALPVAVDNDANLAALAEHRLGAARGARVCVAITLGTGVGCGIVIEGRIFRGAWGGAGELGHVPLGTGHSGCACGVAGCAEAEASAAGLTQSARALGLEPAEAGTVFARAATGHRGAMEAVERFTERLGALVATAVDLLNPDMVVLGGGLARSGDVWIELLRRAVSRHALPSHVGALEIELAAFGERAGAVGAGLLAWDRFGG